MRRLARWLAVVLVAVPLSACGIPDGTEVVSHGAGPSPGAVFGEDSAPVRNGQDATTDRATFVMNYLDAAAGEPEAAVQRARDFLPPAARDAFKPPLETVVVRLLENPLVNPGSSDVRLRVQHVGVLTREGVLEPPATPGAEYQLTVDAVEGSTGLFLVNRPSTLMISDKALDRFYERRAIYFWNAERNRLVPDMRYLPREVPPERQPTVLLTWLTRGPARWLDGAVEGLPEGTELVGNVPAGSNGRLQINLSAQVASADRERLGHQLRWSLHPNPTTSLEVRIGEQVLGTYQGDGYLASNGAWRAAPTPERFCVVNGQVRRMRTSASPTDPVPLLDEATNRNVRYAAMTRAASTTYAALVVTDGERSSLRLGAGGPGRPVSFATVPLTGVVSRPVWASRPPDGDPNGARGFILVDGRLFSFTTNGGEPRPVDWPGAPADLTAVAAAPDGNRIAVIAGGQLYVAAVATTSGVVRANQPRPVAAVMRNLTAVDWSSEGSLVVAGVRSDTGRVAIMDVTIDGSSQEARLPDLGSAQVAYLVAVPGNPISDARDAEAVAYVAENVAYDALASPQRIDSSSVVGPAATPVTLAGAPFFLY